MANAVAFSEQLVYGVRGSGFPSTVLAAAATDAYVGPTGYETILDITGRGLLSRVYCYQSTGGTYDVRLTVDGTVILITTVSTTEDAIGGDNGFLASMPFGKSLKVEWAAASVGDDARVVYQKYELN